MVLLRRITNSGWNALLCGFRYLAVIGTVGIALALFAGV